MFRRTHSKDYLLSGPKCQTLVLGFLRSGDYVGKSSRAKERETRERQIRKLFAPISRRINATGSACIACFGFLLGLIGYSWELQHALHLFTQFSVLRAKAKYALQSIFVATGGICGFFCDLFKLVWAQQVSYDAFRIDSAQALFPFMNRHSHGFKGFIQWRGTVGRFRF